MTIAAPPSGVATEFVSATAMPPSALDLLRGRVRRTLGPAAAVDAAAEVVDDDLGAARREEERVLATEAAARAGDDRNLAVESEVSHGG